MNSEAELEIQRLKAEIEELRQLGSQQLEAELERREAEIDSGELEGIDSKELIAQLREELKNAS